jgi:multidrug efflux system outer membrane protein
MIRSSRRPIPLPPTARTAAVTASALGLLLLLTTGCVDQRKEVATYRKILDGPKPIQVKRQYTEGEPLTLEASLFLANRYDEELAIQGEDYLQSLIERNRAYAAFMPTIGISPSFTWQNKRLNSGGVLVNNGGTGSGTTGTPLGGNSGSTGTGTGTGIGVGGTGTTGGTGVGGTSTVFSSGNRGYTTFDVPIGARANLFNGFRDVATVRGAYANIRRQRGLLLDEQERVLLNTAQTYYQVLLAERSVEVLSNSAGYQDARVRDMVGRLRAGIAQQLDVAQSEAQAAATRAQLVSAEANVQNARTALAFLTNASVESAALADRLAVPNNLPTPQEEVDLAVRIRPDIAAARAAVEVARQNVEVAVGEYYPSIGVSLNYYLHRETIPTSVEWAGLLAANIPIFSAGIIEADVRDAWSQLRQQMLFESELIRQANQDVRINLHNLAASRRRISELRTEVAASQEALRQSTQRYTVGLALNLDVLTAENQLLSAQLDLATEQFNFKVFFIDLLRATGQLVRPRDLHSMSSDLTTQPTTEEMKPVAQIYSIPPMSVPRPALPPASQPESQPTTLPLPLFPTTEPSVPTTQP